MTGQSFAAGDLVRVRRSTIVPVGTLGRVSMALISVVNMYFVQFDGEHHPTLMHASDLEFVAAAPADEGYS
jgi:hypothetical protein